MERDELLEEAIIELCDLELKRLRGFEIVVASPKVAKKLRNLMYVALNLSKESRK